MAISLGCVDSWVENYTKWRTIISKQVNHVQFRALYVKWTSLAVYEKHPTNDVYRSMRLSLE